MNFLFRKMFLKALDRLATVARRSGIARLPGLGSAGRTMYTRLIPSRPIPTAHGFHLLLHRRRDAIHDEIFRTGTYEPATTAAFESLLEPGDTVVDVGAHIGYFTLLASKLVGPTGRVFAFEPVPENHDLLVRNVELSGASNVTVVRSAVGDHDGTITLHLQPTMSGGHSVLRDGVPVEVPSVRLDTYFADDEGRIDLVKIDVEGAEMHAFRGMAGTIRRQPDPRVIVEYFPRLMASGGIDPASFLAAVESELGCAVEACLAGDRTEAPDWLDRIGGGQANLLLRRPGTP